MSTQIMESRLTAVKTDPGKQQIGFARVLSFLAPLVLAGVFILAQWQGWMARLSTESGLVNLSLIAYIAASVLYLMFLIQRETLLENLGSLVTMLGFGLNIAAWGLRGVITNHYPLSNLYDTALALAMTTTGATLAMVAIYRHRFVGAFTLPIAALFLILANLYGDQLNDLPPVLISYWRPIHVSIAMAAYGVASLTFTFGILYLLKDGMKTELIGIFVMLFPLLTFGLISGGSVLARGTFEMNLVVGSSPVPELTKTIPHVGELFRIALFVSLFTVLCFAGYLYTRREAMKKIGHWLTRVALVVQAGGLGWLIYQVSTAPTGVNLLTQSQRAQISAAWLQQFGAELGLEFRSSPASVACIFVALALTSFIVVFAWKRERILETVPSLKMLDSLTYKAVTVAFPLLVLMTVTGAVWANESWGRYWGWDPKEIWALITCLVYAIFLHTRMVYGWKGRKTALFAVLGFMSVIFTYIGVSFILPGLHSYATL